MVNDVEQYYDDNFELEWDRLNNPYSVVEFNSTMYIIDKYFPKTGSICDIGCGPGRYSIELLKKGYKVTLFELSVKELKLAEERINNLNLKAEAYICENALNLHLLESESYDAILLMGPMYHVLDESQRQSILSETYRILKKDGIAIIAYLNSWGILKAGVTEFSDTFSNIENIYGYLNEQKFGPDESFTNVYFSTPSKALEEIKSSGFELVSYAGAEGFLSGIESNIIELSSENKDVYNNLIKVSAETCEYPQYRDATEHLHVVVRK